MNNKIISIVVIVIVIIGGFFLFKNETVAPTDTNTNTNVDTNMPVPGSDVPDTGVVKEFTVDAGAFYFAPSTMSVNQGDTVRITVTNVGGTHDFRLDEFDVATKVLNAGQSEVVEFIASQSGNFFYYCSVGNHRAQGMVGNFIVN